MAAYNYTQPADATVETISSVYRASLIALYANSTGTLDANLGPIPFCVRYVLGDTTSFLYVQTDRTLVTSGAMTTVGNYILLGTSPPTVTAVTFTTGKNYIKLTLSGALIAENAYKLKVAANTFTDGISSIYNIVTPVPIYVDITPIQSGIAQDVAVGTPVMS